jgi:hypothetical protein
MTRILLLEILLNGSKTFLDKYIVNSNKMPILSSDFVLLVYVLALTSCQNPSRCAMKDEVESWKHRSLPTRPYETRSLGSGKWRNEYKNNFRLAGVEIITNQWDGPSETLSHDGKHPAEVFYHFWNGTILWISYTPEGKQTSNQWVWLDHRRSLEQCLEKTGEERCKALTLLALFELGDNVNSWSCVDFSFGSDPGFLRHRDPRRVILEYLSAPQKTVQ